MQASKVVGDRVSCAVTESVLASLRDNMATGRRILNDIVRRPIIMSTQSPHLAL